MNLFLTAISDALCALVNHAGETVKYLRGNDWVETLAAEGNTEFEVDDGNGALVEYRSYDFIIPAANLVMNGTRIEPRRGDQIRRTRNGIESIYEVMRPDGGDQVWRYMDGGQSHVRVHTKMRAN